jgi:LL-H family phage holin
MKLIEPYLETIVTALAGLLVTVLLAVISALRTRVYGWLAARTTAAEQQALHLIAKEACALAERLYIEQGGQEKMQQAIAYAAEEFRKRGIAVSPAKLEAAIEAAWLDYHSRAMSSSAGAKSEVAAIPPPAESATAATNAPSVTSAPSSTNAPSAGSAADA